VSAAAAAAAVDRKALTTTLQSAVGKDAKNDAGRCRMFRRTVYM